jgi:hypothetical protein
VSSIFEPSREIETNLTVVQPTAEDLAGRADGSDEMPPDDDVLIDQALFAYSDSSDSELESGYVQPATSEVVDSNIFSDVFHVQDRVNREVYHTHTLHAAFARAFSDTMLVPDKGDKRRVEAVLQKKELTWDKVRRSTTAWLWKRVQRYIPEKSLLHKILSELFQCWGPIICSKSNAPLFNDDAWKKARGVLHDVEMGWVTDPTGIPMYTVEGHDKNGLTIYHCLRGTNSVEGAVHNPIRRCFGSLNASPEHADCLVADFRHRHNTNVGTLHKMGSRYQGHYDPWLDHDISVMRADILWKSKPSLGPVPHDTDPLSFAQTEDIRKITFGHRLSQG